MRKFSFILAILLTITLAVKPVYAVEDLKGDENDYSIELQQYLEELQQFVNEVNCNDAHDENLIDSSLYFFNCAGCNYDQTGDVNFYYNNVKKVTIKEPSM